MASEESIGKSAYFDMSFTAFAIESSGVGMDFCPRKYSRKSKKRVGPLDALLQEECMVFV